MRKRPFAVMAKILGFCALFVAGVFIGSLPNLVEPCVRVTPNGAVVVPDEETAILFARAAWYRPDKYGSFNVVDNGRYWIVDKNINRPDSAPLEGYILETFYDGPFVEIEKSTGRIVDRMPLDAVKK